MTNQSVDLLLRRSELRIRISCDLRNNVNKCLERSLQAIVKSRQLLADSEALLSYPESIDPDALTLTVERAERPPTDPMLLVSQHEFDAETVPTDKKHFRDCGFRNCTLLYSGDPVIFESCRFHECRFEFSGAAGRTVQFLDCFGLLPGQTPDHSADPADSPAYLVN
jgi:hypothetical protein